jgi:hypothetical protein
VEKCKKSKICKEPLPGHFLYEIINDESNSALEKIEVEIELNKVN